MELEVAAGERPRLEVSGDDRNSPRRAETPETAPERAEAAPRFDSSRAIRLLRELGPKVNEGLVVLMPNLLSFLRHDDPAVVKQSISSGTILFVAVLEESALQHDAFGRIAGWLIEIWYWVTQFKDVVREMMFKPCSVGVKLLCVKFLEVCVFHFTRADGDDGQGMKSTFDSSRLAGSHPSMDPVAFQAEADRTVGLLLNSLQAPYNLSGPVVITIINSLASIARNRLIYFDVILPGLLGFVPGIESVFGAHSSSIRYSLRTAFFGFLKCNNPLFVQIKDKLIAAVRTLCPSDNTEQSIRQIERMSRNSERASRDSWVSKDDNLRGDSSSFGEPNKKRPVEKSSTNPVTTDEYSKRARFNPDSMNLPVQKVQENYDNVENPVEVIPDPSVEVPMLDSYLTPTQQMIGMVGALLNEGERGAESLDLLVSNMHGDLLIDIVVEILKNKNSLEWFFRNFGPPNYLPPNNGSPQGHLQTSLPPAPSRFAPAPEDNHGPSTSSVNAHSAHSIPSASADAKRDPRRDLLRLDPRRAVPSTTQISVKLDADKDINLPNLHSSHADILVTDSVVEIDTKSQESYVNTSPPISMIVDEHPVFVTDVNEPGLSSDTRKEDLPIIASTESNQEIAVSLSASEDVDTEAADFDLVSKTSPTEDFSNEPPAFATNFKMSDEEQISMHKSAIKRIMKSCDSSNLDTSLSLLAHLLAQSINNDYVLKLMEEHIVLYSDHQKGHELAMKVLFYLQALTFADSSDQSSNYEKFFCSIANSLIDVRPASDKYFSKLLGEAPVLPNSVFKLLEGLCESHITSSRIKDNDGDRVTQGLGTLWNLILGRAPLRVPCLDIALKCAIHTQEEVRTKAIRLVTNKLFSLTYAAEKIEQFAVDTLLSVVDQQAREKDSKRELHNQEPSVSGSLNSEVAASESESVSKSTVITLSEAQRHTSLFFALCTKKPNLLKKLFEVYERAPKAVRQAIHRHIQIVIGNVGTSPEFLDVIYNVPDGNDYLLALMLQVLTEESTPSPDLIAAVKHVYETKQKSVTILIPLLSFLSKEEVLPIFPRLVDLPLENFQTALARILQGSAHTGPALTPTQVLVAIHDINPDIDRVGLKKITEACNACFEQRTVFTEQVLTNSLNQLVEKVPIPFLFMRTVFQAIEAYPSLNECVMGILSKLVAKKVWRMPKLWAGFLKFAIQAKPHSFGVLLELPPPQLEHVLNKHPDLRGALSTHVTENNLLNVPSETLEVLGIAIM